MASSHSQHLRLPAAAPTAAVLAAALAVLGLLGWVTGLSQLQSVTRNRPAMMPNTALCILLGAAALYSLAPAQGRRVRRAAGRVCAALMLAIGAATLAEYATGIDLGLDRIFLALSSAPDAPPVGAGPTFPGRPAAPTAAVLTLLAAALLLLDVRWRGRLHPAELLALAAGVVVHAVLTGHAYDAELLFRSPHALATGTAINTALALALLVVAILCVRPGRGLMALLTSDRSSGVLVRRLLGPAIAGPPLLGFLVLAALGGEATQQLSLSHALLATSSATIAAALTVATARSLDRVDAARRRFEEELRRWRDVAASTDEAIIAETPGGIVTCWNPAAERILGWPAGDVLGCSVLTLVPDDRRAEHAAALERLGRGERIAPFETVRLHRDGSRIDVAVSMSPVLDAQGRVIGISKIARDIRERKAAEAEIGRSHAAEHALRVQIEALSVATEAIFEAVAKVKTSDLDTVLLTIVDQARALTGARYAALGVGTDPTRPFDRWIQVGMLDAEVAAIGRQPRPIGLLGEVLRHGRALRVADIAACERRVGFPPGHPSMRSFLGVPLLRAGRCHGTLYLADRLGAEAFTADDQRVLEFLAARAATALETARLYHEEALAKAWLQGVIDGMPEAVILVDAGGRVSGNELARRLASVDDGPPGDGPPRFDLRDAAGALVARSELPLARALRGEASTAIELLARRREGDSLPVLASASPLRDAAGRIVGAVSVLRDITPLKQLEQMRLEWTGVVAHDLRQPIGVIAVSAKTLEKACARAEEPVIGRSIARIHRAVDRLSRMVRDLLDATRIEAHQLALALEPVDLEQLLAEVVARTVADRAIRLRITRPLPRVRADPGRVEQVLDNLLSNALKYGDPGTEIELAAHPEGREVVVSTTNQGRALAPDELARLFTRFYRAPSAGQVEGLGLGLYLTRGLVEAHGGRIWAESAGRTTTFRFTLPLADAQA